MDLNPPAGSKISVVDNQGSPRVVIPQTGGIYRYFAGAFLLFWLGMWTLGFRSAASQILAGHYEPFLIFWICGWTLGGIWAVYVLFRTLRPSVPETLGLGRNSVAYDSGLAPPQFNSYRRNQNPFTAWRSAFPKRRQADLDRKELQTLR